MTRNPFIAAALCALFLAAGCAPGEPQAEPTHTATRSPAPKAPAVEAALELGCGRPIPVGASLASLRKQYGAEASVETLPGPEGTEYEALVLWKDDPARRVEVIFGESAAGPVSMVSIGEGSMRSIAGLRIGDTPAQAQALNGRPFGFYGFAWDYGGNTTGWQGGKLETLPGGCSVSGRLDPRADDVPQALMGDAELSSAVAGLDKADAHFGELRLLYPE